MLSKLSYAVTGELLSKLTLVIPLLLFMVWGGLALFYQLSGTHKYLGYVMIGLWSLLIISTCYAVLNAFYPRLFILGSALAALFLLVWWVNITPSLHKNWADDVARSSYGLIDNNRVLLSNVRNFTWRSDTDYDVRWEERQVNIDQLNRVDMVLSYWMGPAVAHTLVSFGFEDGQHIVFSVEIRKEQHEKFSALGGFFKMFEMALVIADERDIIRTRSNIRGENVYLYEVDMSPDARRALFLAYIDKANELLETPSFYHTLTANCTTIVYKMISNIVDGLTFNYRLLFSGYLPEYLYDLKVLAPSNSLTELREQAHINERAKSSPDDPSFSEQIRIGIPRVF